MNCIGCDRIAVVVIGVCAAVLSISGCGARGSAVTEDPAPASPDHFTYGPFDVQYRVTSHTVQEMDMGGQISSSRYGLQWYLSAVHTPPTLTLTVDSVPTMTGTAQGVSARDLEQAAGLTLTGSLSPTGEVLDFSGSEASSDFVHQLMQSIERFLPRIPETGVAPGDSWTDTLRSTNTSGGLAIEIQLVTESHAGSWVTAGNLQTLEVSTVSVYTLSGGGVQMGAEIDLDGTGTRHSTLLVGNNGRFLGGISADTTNMMATVAAMGASIPIFQTRFDTVAVVR